jgi:hypothetical protein
VVVRDLRRLSRALFGRTHCLEIAAAMARAEGPFYFVDLAAQLNEVPRTAVFRELEAFQEAGLICLLPPITGRRKYYERMPSVMWATFDELYREATRGQETDSVVGP